MPSRSAILTAASQQLASQEPRDLEPDASLLEALLSIPTTAWDSFSADDLYKWHTLLTGVRAKAGTQQGARGLLTLKQTSHKHP